MLKGKCLAAAKKALKEGRLFFRVTDQYGYSCNGGDKTFRLSPAVNNTPGKWSAKLDTTNVVLFRFGYHATLSPAQWRGLFVYLVEIDKVYGLSDDKVVCASMRELGKMEPHDCILPSVWVASSRPYLSGANLSGAHLYGAELSGANLSGAELSGANLSMADLSRADLSGAELSGANLSGAELSRADLFGANLYGADLSGANLYGADLSRADLSGANLYGADLSEARLTNAIGYKKEK